MKEKAEGVGMQYNMITVAFTVETTNKNILFLFREKIA